MTTPHLFTPFSLRGVRFRNRIFVSPMCQYSATDGMPNDWHLVHLGSRAVGGAGLVIVEATAVTAEGRISPGDTGLWNDKQAEAFSRIAGFINAQGAVAGIQLAHAGRKASTTVPWVGNRELRADEGAWQAVAPSPIRYSETYPNPRELSTAEVEEVPAHFAAAARRARSAGFKTIEIHMAHGYLLHEFLSPLTNRRTDSFGGSFEGRVKLPVMVARAVRDVWPLDLPLFVRISATDYVEGGWDVKQSVLLARLLRDVGVDLIDCSSGGLAHGVRIPVEPGYQVPFAAEIRREAGIATAAVGLITDTKQAAGIVGRGDADAVVLARAMLRDPYWALHAAQALSVDVTWPNQYLRAKPT